MKKYEIVRKYLHAFQKGNKEIFEEILHPNFPNFKAERFSKTVHDRTGYIENHSKWGVAFDISNLEIIEELILDEKAIIMWVCEGVQNEEIFGLPPTNKKATIKGIHFLYFEDEKIIDAVAQFNQLELFIQLGHAIYELKDESKIARYVDLLESMGLTKRRSS